MAPANLLKRMSNELGFTTLLLAHRDVHLLLVTRFIRMFAYGSSTLVLIKLIESIILMLTIDT